MICKLSKSMNKNMSSFWLSKKLIERSADKNMVKNQDKGVKILLKNPNTTQSFYNKIVSASKMRKWRKSNDYSFSKQLSFMLSKLREIIVLGLKHILQSNKKLLIKDKAFLLMKSDREETAIWSKQKWQFVRISMGLILNL